MGRVPATTPVCRVERVKLLSILPSLWVPTVYSGLQHVTSRELHTFCNASKEVTYVKLYTADGETDNRFVIGKSKLAPHHTIPRLCDPIPDVEAAEFVAKHLDIYTGACYFYTDSRIVLGYICNETCLFHVYVANRINRIKRATS